MGDDGILVQCPFIAVKETTKVCNQTVGLHLFAYLFVCEIFIEGFKLLQWPALLSKQALSYTYYIDNTQIYLQIQNC